MKTTTEPTYQEELRTAIRLFREALSHIDIGLKNPDLYEIRVRAAQGRIERLFDRLTTCDCGKTLNRGACPVCDNDD